MTKEELIKDGWKESTLYESALARYEKDYNGFHYTLTYMPVDVYNFRFTNSQYDWQLHIDNPDCDTVANVEVDSLEHIELLTRIYKCDK